MGENGQGQCRAKSDHVGNENVAYLRQSCGPGETVGTPVATTLNSVEHLL